MILDKNSKQAEVAVGVAKYLVLRMWKELKKETENPIHKIIVKHYLVKIMKGELLSKY